MSTILSHALSEGEFETLIAWLMQGEDKNNRCGIIRADRAMLYQVALGTGFRQQGLLSLTPASFHVAPKLTRPFIVLGAQFNKNRTDREQPIRRDLANAIHDWLMGRRLLADRAVWAARPHADLALRFRNDIAGARAAWISAGATPAERKKRAESTFLRYVYDDGRGNVWADFHSLRHTGITLVARGSDLRAAQAWADHSTPVLTAKYRHLDLMDEARVLGALPGPAGARGERKPNEPQGDAG